MESEYLTDDVDIGKNWDPLVILCMIGCFVSPICLLIHLFKFFSAPSQQNLPSKNLASYCICLLLLYVCMASLACFTGIFGHGKLLTLREYLYITSSLLLFNMSFDTYLCMRRSVKSFRLSKGSRVNSFIIYTIFAWGVSILVTAVIYFVVKSADDRFSVTVAITMFVRMMCFGLFCLSVYYIKSADITNTNLKSHVFMHTRLLLVNGITSILWYVTVAMIFFFNMWNVLLRISLFLSVLLYAYDGVFIALFYTFKKGMFDGEHLKKCTCTKICVISRDIIVSCGHNGSF